MFSPLTRAAITVVLAVSLLLAPGCELVADPATGRSISGAVVVPSLPTLADTMALHASLGQTPDGAVKVFILACLQYGSRNSAEHLRGKQAIQRLSIEYMNDPAWDDLTTAQTFVRNLDGEAWIFRSYAVGTSPENGYAMNPADFELNLDRIEPGGTGGQDVWLRSSGADSPRRIYLKRGTQDGLYYLEHFGNLYVDVRPPVNPGEQRFE